jgi:hypothetical protein
MNCINRTGTSQNSQQQNEWRSTEADEIQKWSADEWDAEFTFYEN